MGFTIAFDNFSLDWMLFVAIMGFIVRLLHHADPYGVYITNTIEISIVFFFYLIIPTKLHYRAISTFLISALAIIHLFFFDPFTILPHKITIVSIFFLVNTVAFISSSRSYSYRRSQYEARTQREKLTKELERQANTDSLTGVCNRRAFLQRVEDEFQQFTRYKKEFSLAVFDLDKFKDINDQFGHYAGDAVLMKLCEIISSSKREADVFGRIGGDEFALLLPFTSLPRALNVVERLQELIRNESIQIEDSYIHLTVSGGVATISPGATNPEDLFRKVDNFLYKAKAKGGNRVEAQSSEK